jgi:hypothetical protein
MIFVLLLLRRPDCIMHPQFWAEDGNLFFRSQLLFGFKASVLVPYAGYLCVVQHTIAAAVSVFPVYYTPMVYAVAGSVVDAVCCSLFILPIFRNIIRSDWLRATVCILTAVIPVAVELVGTLVNIQWYVLLAGTLLLFRAAPAIPNPQKDRVAARATGWGLVGLLIGLTNPVLIVGIPFCLWNLVRSRRADRWYEVGVLLGLAIQLSIFARSHQTTPNFADGGNLQALASAVALAYIYRVILSLVIGFTLVKKAAIAKSVLVPVIAGCAFMVFTIIVLWKASAEDRWKIVIALYVAASSLAITLGGRDFYSQFISMRDFHGFFWERYLFLAGCAFIYLMAISVNVLFKEQHVPIQTAILATVFALGMVSNYRIPPFAEKYWRESARVIQDRVDHHQIGPGHPRIVAPIHPDPWQIILE